MLQTQKENVQQRLVVWVVLTICLQILALIIPWPFLKYVAWLAAAYCIWLIILWCYLEWQLLKNKMV